MEEEKLKDKEALTRYLAVPALCIFFIYYFHLTKFPIYLDYNIFPDKSDRSFAFHETLAFFAGLSLSAGYAMKIIRGETKSLFFYTGAVQRRKSEEMTTLHQFVGWLMLLITAMPMLLGIEGTRWVCYYILPSYGIISILFILHVVLLVILFGTVNYFRSYMLYDIETKKRKAEEERELAKLMPEEKEVKI